jgi:hypothetical protein
VFGALNLVWEIASVLFYRSIERLTVNHLKRLQMLGYVSARVIFSSKIWNAFLMLSWAKTSIINHSYGDRPHSSWHNCQKWDMTLFFATETHVPRCHRTLHLLHSTVKFDLCFSAAERKSFLYISDFRLAVYAQATQYMILPEFYKI